MIDVLSLGAGVQSSALLLMSCRGDLPKLACAVFADTRFEPPAVYEHLAWLETIAAQAGIPVHRVSVGDLREDAADGKRYASIPFFVKNPDGKQGRLPRQCTPEYKIEPVERFIRREVMGLAPKQRAPKEPVVRQWLGITSDEIDRMSYPGRMKSRKVKTRDLFGETAEKDRRWKPNLWKLHAYPFTDSILTPQRRRLRAEMLPAVFSRTDCIDWLTRHYPDRQVPRSACICCPFRSNDEWRRMKEEDPESWQRTCEFDEAIRLRDEAGWTDERQRKVRKPLVGTIYTHRQMVPLAMADLDGDGEAGAGCGLFACS